MGKKQRDRGRGSSRRAQITIFIIIGILILFIFLFLLMLANQLRKGQLQTEQEEVLSKVFQKEALRIFVEDCLEDGIEEGLILLGKQGRIWKDQGGTTSFSEGITGITYGPDEDQVAYGITHGEEQFQYPEAYPCTTDENAPEFCRYTYPDITVGFGQLELRAGAIQSDLQRYLIEQTVSCVKDFVAVNISAAAKVEETDIDLKLAILDEGISVQVSYPLKFRLAGQEFFQLSEFDFFHPTKFKQLLDSAILFPLEHDQKFVDFQYTDATLRNLFFEYGNLQLFIGCEPHQEYYFCKRSLPSEKYKNLNLNLKILSMEQGDDLFIFSDIPQIVKDKLYTLRIARQNRPPALDYVHRAQCLLEGNPEKSYDYLVIPGDKELGAIDITAKALDPDEDAVEYGFVSDDFTKDPTYPDNALDNVFFTSEVGNPGWHTIVAKAADEHNLEDNQTVRILVDRPITMNLDLKSIYNDITAFATPVYFVSREDPVILDVTFPQSSLTEDLEEISLQYISAGKEFTFPIEQQLDEHDPQSKTIILPQKKGGLQPQTAEDIEKFINPDFFTTHPFRELALGKLVLDYKINYCGTFAQSESVEAIVSVTACVPHKNQTNPWAYPYHEYTYGVDEEGDTNFLDFKAIDNTANLFQATHACCVGPPDVPGKWDVAPAGTSCFESPLPDCEGKIPEYTALGDNKGYVFEQKLDFCDGQRGNICGNPALRKSRLWNNELRCGDNTISLSCRAEIPQECQGNLSWGYVDSNNDGQNDRWCHGKMGCSSVCTGPVVAGIGAPVAKSTVYNMNTRAKTNFFTTDEALQVHCGCTDQDRTVGNVCDSNFDGIFEGICQTDGSCR